MTYKPTVTVWSSLKKLWKSGYKYRFVPWVVFNVRTDARPSATGTGITAPLGTTPVSTKKDAFEIHVVSRENDRLLSDNDLAETLLKLFTEFKTCETNLRGDYYSNQEQADNYFNNLRIMNEILGFSVRTGISKVSPDAGLGVFVATGSVKAGSIVGLYPGTIYKVFEPLFFPSINNSFIFRCSDGIHVDGKSKGVSKSIFKSCAARDKFDFHLPCADQSWLTPYPLNPLNTGQYVNNKTGLDNHNVVYQECFLSLPHESVPGTFTLPLPLWKYLPNVWSSPENNTGLKIIPLIAVKDIQQGEELLSSYFTVVRS